MCINKRASKHGRPLNAKLSFHHLDLTNDMLQHSKDHCCQSKGRHLVGPLIKKSLVLWITIVLVHEDQASKVLKVPCEPVLPAFGPELQMLHKTELLIYDG